MNTNNTHTQHAQHAQHPALRLSFDAHTHLHLDERAEAVERAHLALEERAGSALMCTEPPDWARALALASAHHNARLFVGVHPWFAHRYASQLTDRQGESGGESGSGSGREGEGWLSALRELLTQDERLCVGEIGLDRRWRTPDTGEVAYQAQLTCFEAQLALAAELKRPVSVHCVHAQGDLYRLLSEAPELPPTIALHAFGGARGTVEQLTRSRFGARLYFGFAACVNFRSPKTKEVLKAVPPDRLLLESDRSSALSDLSTELLTTLAHYQEAQGWPSLEEAAQETTRNAERWLLGEV